MKNGNLERRCSQCTLKKKDCSTWKDTKEETTVSGWDLNRFAIYCIEFQKKIIYRPHRSTLVNAMKEAKEFINENEMKKYIVNKWENSFTINDIVIENETINDDRIGWRDTKYVCIKRIGTTIYDYPQCIGMCATDYDLRR